MLAARTTTSCRAFALAALFLTCTNARISALDKVVPPKVPIENKWTVALPDGVAVPPLMDDARAYVALRSAHLVAFDLSKPDQELWRIDKAITAPMAVYGNVLFVSAGDAVEALSGTDHTTLWTVRGVTTVAPLVATAGWVIAVTDAEVIAINAGTGAIVWRQAAGGVALAPAIDGDRVVLGAKDGRLLVLALETGDPAWQFFVPEGVTALAAHGGLVYAGGGDKQFYCVKNGKLARGWPVRVGSIVIGRIAVDDERVYFAAIDNVIRGLDRSNGVQRWMQPMRNRPYSGVAVRGHLVFVPLATTHDLPMLFDGNGKPSGTIALPGDALQTLPPAVEESPEGVKVVAVTGGSSGGLSNQWQLSMYATTGEPVLVPVADFFPEVGAFLLTDPALQPIGKVLGSFVLADPPLVPVSVFGFPLQLLDPPLEPLTTLPGLQMRPLSPQLPPRHESSGPGG